MTGYGVLFVLFGFVIDRPSIIINGLYKIILERGVLITDYFSIGGIGAAFVNAGLLTLISIFILYKLNINISGISIASVFLMTSFAMFGKNIFNIWTIILGVFIYAKIQKDKFSKYIYIALFGTSMSPTVTEFMFSIHQPVYLRIILSLVIGLSIGLILPPLSSYMLRVHQGFNLYNIGFTSGMIGTIYVSVFKSFGYTPESRLIWSTGNNVIMSAFLFFIFSSMIFLGYYLNGKSFRGVTEIFQHPGRLVSDFVALDGFNPTLINMGINGFLGMLYVLIVRGELNGPTIGGILTIVGFGAFGKHVRTILPIFLGVYIGGLTTTWNVNDPQILLAALFSTALAPIAGQFGWQYGVLAGFINSSVVLNVGILHGGLNLYNTGFSSGIVAAALIPLIEAFRKDDSD